MGQGEERKMGRGEVRGPGGGGEVRGPGEGERTGGRGEDRGQVGIRGGGDAELEGTRWRAGEDANRQLICSWLL